MVTSTKAKTGRKHKPHETREGKHIDGLRKCPDGRWRYRDPKTGRDVKFTEPDERLAVARFYRATASTEDTIRLPGRLANKPFATTPPVLGHIEPEDWQAAAEYDPAQDGRVKIDSAEMWAWLRTQIIERPKYVAKMVGIEQIGYLESLPKPTPSPTLDEVGKLYHERAKITDHWRTMSGKYWDEFVGMVGVTTLREVTQDVVVNYYDSILALDQSPTYAKHRFTQLRTILHFARRRGQWVDDVSRVLNYMAILVPPKAVAMDPQPIAREDFWTLHRAADTQMRAMLLLALNAALYPSEVAAVMWADLDLDRGTLVMDRNKTGVPRVAVLWAETIAALKALDRRTEAVSLTDATRQQHNGNTVAKAFRRIRHNPKLQFSHVRDGAYTSACESSAVQFDHARILAGHRTGMADHYVKRRPTLVSDACKAIYDAYFPPTPKK
jgi:integrase